MRYVPAVVALTVAVVLIVLTVTISPLRLVAAIPVGVLAAIGIFDFFQNRHSILRNYPIVGHFRFMLESIRPEIQQYFVEPDTEGKPYPRTDRNVIYERAKLENQEVAFGTELDVQAQGYEWMAHSIAAKEPSDGPQPRVTVGGDQCSKPYDMALLNVSAMSFGSLSSRAIEALNKGAARGGFAHDTGEGSLSDYHLNGGDLVWEIGTAYFGCRTDEGGFDEAIFRKFVARLRDLSGGKPTGFKLCFGSRIELLAIVKAMLETGILPDFIIVDGGEGGTGAGPLEFSNHVGMPLREGLLAVQNALVGAGLRDQIRVGASGKVSTGFHVARLMALGADYTNAARAMMMSIGCIQTQECHLNTCPVGVATQNPRRVRALNVERSAARCFNYQGETVKSLRTLAAAHGLDHPGEFLPRHMMRRINETEVSSFAEIYEWLNEGELLDGGPESWAIHWSMADPSRFTVGAQGS